MAGAALGVDQLRRRPARSTMVRLVAMAAVPVGSCTYRRCSSSAQVVSSVSSSSQLTGATHAGPIRDHERTAWCSSSSSARRRAVPARSPRSSSRTTGSSASVTRRSRSFFNEVDDWRGGSRRLPPPVPPISRVRSVASCRPPTRSSPSSTAPLTGCTRTTRTCGSLYRDARPGGADDLELRTPAQPGPHTTADRPTTCGPTRPTSIAAATPCSCDLGSSCSIAKAILLLTMEDHLADPTGSLQPDRLVHRRGPRRLRRSGQTRSTTTPSVGHLAPQPGGSDGSRTTRSPARLLRSPARRSSEPGCRRTVSGSTLERQTDARRSDATAADPARRRRHRPGREVDGPQRSTTSGRALVLRSGAE